MKNAVMALDEKYVKLLKKSMKKFKGLSYVDSSLNPVPKSLRKSIEREIFIQLKKNRFNPKKTWTVKICLHLMLTKPL